MINFFKKEQLIEILKYSPAFLIFVGCIKLIIFYNLFGIRIIDYLDLTEVLISFFDNLINYLLTTIVPMLAMLTFFGKKIGEESQKSFTQNSELNFVERIKSDFKEFYILIILTLVLLIFQLVTNKWNYQLLCTLISYPGIYVIIFITREVRISYIKQYRYTIPATYINIFMMAYLFITLIIQNTFKEATEIKDEHKYFGTEIYFEKDTIKCDSNITYVGQTKNFLFVYDIQKHKSLVFPKTKLQKLILVQK